MPRVRMLTSEAGENFSRQYGEIVEMAAEEVEAAIAAGKVELVRETAVETAAEKPAKKGGK